MTTNLAEVESITFDFGNTLVPVGQAALRRVVELTADGVAAADPAIDREAFLATWAEERDRQFRENVPQFREVDLAERLVRVFARLRGMAPPGPEETWDQAAAAGWSDPAEVDRVIDVYSRAFVEGLPPTAGADRLIERLARDGRPMAILSNWPLAVTVDRYVEARGWAPAFRAVVVSQRVGTIKPHPAIFEAARAALGDPAPATILHVGDDWAADVVGAAGVGWRTAWVKDRPADTPLPTSEPGGDVRADVEIGTVAELADVLDAERGEMRRAPVG